MAPRRAVVPKVASMPKDVSKGDLTHLDQRGRARMVDVAAKKETVRDAIARCEVMMAPETLDRITKGTARKGDVLAIAQVAAIAAAKRTWEIIPLCHPIPLTGISVSLVPDLRRSCVRIEAQVQTIGRTGVEMEALVAVSAAALTVYDMLKSVERGMLIQNIRLMRKSGGASGLYERDEAAGWSPAGSATDAAPGPAARSTAPRPAAEGAARPGGRNWRQPRGRR